MGFDDFLNEIATESVNGSSGRMPCSLCRGDKRIRVPDIQDGYHRTEWSWEPCPDCGEGDQ